MDKDIDIPAWDREILGVHQRIDLIEFKSRLLTGFLIGLIIGIALFTRGKSNEA